MCCRPQSPVRDRFAKFNANQLFTHTHTKFSEKVRLLKVWKQPLTRNASILYICVGNLLFYSIHYSHSKGIIAIHLLVPCFFFGGSGSGVRFSTMNRVRNQVQIVICLSQEKKHISRSSSRMVRIVAYIMILTRTNIRTLGVVGSGSR